MVTSEATLKQTNHKRNVHLSYSAKKVAHTLILLHFHAEQHTTRCMTKLKKFVALLHTLQKCTIVHCPTKRSKVDGIRIRRHNMHAVTDKMRLV